REGDGGVLELTLSKEVAAHSEELIDPSFDLATTSNYDVRVDGWANNDATGRASCTGDFNGDGIKDLVVGSVWVNSAGRTYAGAAYVLYGGSANFPPAGAVLDLSNTAKYNIMFQGSAANEGLGSALGTADLNYDGIDDLLIGAAGAD